MGYEMKKQPAFMSYKFKLMVAVILSMVLLEGCAGPKYWPAKEGRALDADTREPLSGVFVIARFFGDYGAIADFRSTCYHVESTITNEKGEYTIASRMDGLDIKMDKRVRFTYYKLGYRRSELMNYGAEGYEEGVYFLIRDTHTSEERLAYLLDIVSKSTCINAGDSEKSLLRLYQELYDEARSIALTKEDEKTVEWLLTDLEKIKFGSEVAQQRHFERLGIKK